MTRGEQLERSVRTQQALVGTEWLFHNWRWVLPVFVASLWPAWLLLQRWRRASQRRSALFDFTLAESLRAKGEPAAAIAIYDKILKHECPDPLIWRCHSGRSLALLARSDATRALADADMALSLAQTLQAKADAAEAAAAKAKAARAIAAASSSSASSSVIPDSNAAAADSNAASPDSDPFLSLPPISLALLHYRRGLVLEALPGPLHTAMAAEAFTRCATLDPSLEFIVGQRARVEMKQRLARAGGARPQVSSPEGKVAAEGESVEAREGEDKESSAEGASDGALRQRAVASAAR